MLSLQEATTVGRCDLELPYPTLSSTHSRKACQFLRKGTPQGGKIPPELARGVSRKFWIFGKSKRIIYIRPNKKAPNIEYPGYFGYESPPNQKRIPNLPHVPGGQARRRLPKSPQGTRANLPPPVLHLVRPATPAAYVDACGVGREVSHPPRVCGWVEERPVRPVREEVRIALHAVRPYSRREEVQLVQRRGSVHPSAGGFGGGRKVRGSVRKLPPHPDLQPAP